MKLRKRHRARLKPAVEDLFDAFEMFTIDIEFNFIHPGAMIIFKFFARELFELCVAADYFNRAVIAFPDWHGGSPKAVAREVPIWSLLNIISEAAMF